MFALLPALVACAGSDDGALVDAPRLTIDRYALDNGLEVILHEDHTLPFAYVSLWCGDGKIVTLRISVAARTASRCVPGTGIVSRCRSCSIAAIAK